MVATYLPLMAKTFNFQLLSSYLWSLVGSAIVLSCFIWVMGGTSVESITLSYAQFAYHPRRVHFNLTLFSQFPVLVIFSCLGFGFIFMGTTSLVMPLAKYLRVPHGVNLYGFVALTYSFGQILGPLLRGLMRFGSYTVIFSVICGAVALFAAAEICQYCLCKRWMALINFQPSLKFLKYFYED
nr:YbfB/YjiJ family MFS transporter [Bartonella massiliensis]